MRQATNFMFDTLANHGGFVWLYTVDGLTPYGELKARPSMIWVETPGTPAVGLVLLEAYRATGDPYYLEKAREPARALELGQHPAGGWNYYIDFDPAGLPEYQQDFFSKCWGWQEYLKPRTNCTFDDYCTTEATRFLLRLFDVTEDAQHKQTLDKALDFILRAQYENGGWPQRFPLDTEHPDYSAACTFNDGVSLDCILLLLEAHDRLGDARCLAAARKGMDFYVRAQLPAPQSGWAQQHDPVTLQPVWGRPFEIGTVCAVQTHENILDLFRFYKITGDKKYLQPVPAALDWLQASVISNAEGYTHTCFYEMGTNRPVYIKQTGTTVDYVQFTLTYEEEGCYPYASRLSVPLQFLRDELARLAALSPEAAQAEYRKEREAAPLPEEVRGMYTALALQKTAQTDDGVRAILEGLDARGGWQDEVSIMDPFSPFSKPTLSTKAYTTGGYIARMCRLINFLDEQTRKRTQ